MTRSPLGTRPEPQRARPPLPQTTPATRMLSRLEARPALALSAMTALVSLLHLGTVPISWRFFHLAGSLVTSGTVLQTYSANPELQFGPLTFLVCAPLSALPWSVGRAASVVVMLVLGVVTLLLVRSVLQIDDLRSSAVWWMAAAIALVAWGELAIRYGHLDDAIALTLIAAALHAQHRSRPGTAAILLAASVDAKPWAVPLVVLLLLEERRLWPRLLGLWTAVIAVCWLPFLIFGLHSVHAAQFSIPIEPASALALLPIVDRTTPWWCRPAQLLLGVLLSFIAVRRRSPAAAVVAFFAVRLGLDPSVKGYYDIELILGTALCDLTLHRSRLPWFTILATATVYAPTYLLTGVPQIHAWVRTVGLIAVTASSLLLAGRARPGDGDPAEAGRSPMRAGPSAS